MKEYVWATRATKATWAPRKTFGVEFACARILSWGAPSFAGDGRRHEGLARQLARRIVSATVAEARILRRHLLLEALCALIEGADPGERGDQRHLAFRLAVFLGEGVRGDAAALRHHRKGGGEGDVAGRADRVSERQVTDAETADMTPRCSARPLRRPIAG